MVAEYDISETEDNLQFGTSKDVDGLKIYEWGNEQNITVLLTYEGGIKYHVEVDREDFIQMVKKIIA